MSNSITAKEIESGISESIRPFFHIGSATLINQALPVIESFWQAVNIFVPKVRLVRPMHVFFGTSPFRIEKENFDFSYSSKGDVINSVLETFIFLDVDKMFRYPKELQIASIIEEFVHGFMNVTDEDLTKEIVSKFYPGIILVNGCYTQAHA